MEGNIILKSAGKFPVQGRSKIYAPLSELQFFTLDYGQHPILHDPFFLNFLRIDMYVVSQIRPCKTVALDFF